MSRLRLLVIDDNNTDIELLRFALDRQREKYELEVLQDGQEALQFIHRHSAAVRPNPCIILVDLHLPMHSGIDIVKAVRREPALAHVRVIVQSVLASPREEAEIRGLGAMYRVKPTKLEDFLQLGAEVIALCKELIAA